MKNNNTEGKAVGTLDTAAQPEQLTLEKIIRLEQEELTELLWSTDRQIYKILTSSINIHEARNSLFKYLNGLERCYFNIYSDNKLKNLHDLEKRHAKNCVRILKNIIRTENENLAGASALAFLWKLAHKRPRQMTTVTKSYLCELLFLKQNWISVRSPGSFVRVFLTATRSTFMISCTVTRTASILR